MVLTFCCFCADLKKEVSFRNTSVIGLERTIGTIHTIDVNPEREIGRYMIDIYQFEFTVGKESIEILGHVNNREYLRWMEKAAIEHAASLGWDAQAYLQRGETWVAREHWIEYLRQTYEGERLTVYSWVSNINGSRSLRRYAIKRGYRVCCVGATEW